MDETTRRKHKQSLYEVIEDWSGALADSGDSNMSWGDKTTALMSDAAFSVLEAVSDVQDYLADNDMLNKE